VATPATEPRPSGRRPSGQRDASVIQFDDVSQEYGDQRVLDGVTFALEGGEVLALVGRSGAGKSTLLKLANRMLLPSRGSVLVEGRDTRAWDAIQLRRRCGYVLQHVGLFPHLTVEANITLVPRLEGWPAARQRERAAELLSLVGLEPREYGQRWPHELSGGQQQRVGVARALSVGPPVLLMDEPFGALDPITRLELRQVFQTVQRDLGQTVLLVTHDVGEAFALATRVGVLEKGSLITCDTPEAIRASTDPRVRPFLDAAATPGAI
jgi:osmoprotectant transport system ATP-binding protein